MEFQVYVMKEMNVFPNKVKLDIFIVLFINLDVLFTFITETLFFLISMKTASYTFKMPQRKGNRGT